MSQGALYAKIAGQASVVDMILWDTILNKLENYNVNTRLIDIRYLDKWVKLYPTFQFRSLLIEKSCKCDE
jgi:hypothetical protein